ncbi:Prefoldin beta-like protein [Choiromyces venosus 120613-1]|uniref:Prefoldin beta-like protein n=1 Tax=Choiromyces venosus 120613-1 TaxID=1336337 RepID=A0A3N4JPQ0_9PEZI|nr:Prefoldin beta-like protein [Choiromyces venosus 120613-1]
MSVQTLQDLTDEFQSLSKDMSTIVQARQKLDSQLQENKSVQKEFANLPSEANIYKLIGPVLVKQDKSEAVMNVDKRLEFITSEITRIEKQIADVQEKQEKKKMEIIQVQGQLQQGAQQQQAQVGV